MGWEALLTGKAAMMASRLVDEIAEAVTHEVSLDGSFAKGEAGLALFFGYRAAVESGVRTEALAWQRLAQAADWLGSDKDQSPWFLRRCLGCRVGA